MHPTRRTAHTRIGKALFETAPHEFPLERFYKYYWPGELSLQARKKAASELYGILKTHQGPCTIIAHSHGCNLALHLAELAHEDGKESCTKIDRLVLLAAPVQEATAHLVSSPVFKRVYACYSITDMIQVADPQKFHRDMRARKDDLPLFSKRLFPSSNKLTQAQITFDKRHPSHNDFIGVPFFKQLPHILSLLDTVHTQGCEHVRLHVPLYGNVPSVIEKKGEVRMLNAHQPSKKDRK
jgi:pimeloyl-ACP methyl ester carboxylesterase